MYYIYYVYDIFQKWKLRILVEEISVENEYKERSSNTFSILQIKDREASHT